MVKVSVQSADGDAAASPAVESDARTAASVACAAPIPVAVAHPIAHLVAGGLRPATVLAVHSAAVVLCIEPLTGVDGHDAARVVTLLAREASGVPNGARTALSASDRPFAGVTADAAAFVGAGEIRLSGLAFRAVRVVRTGVPRVAPRPDAIAAIVAVAAAAPRGVAAEPVDELRSAITAGDAARLRRAVRALVGLGGGSTPGGDDVLAGALAGLRAAGRDVRAHQIAAAALVDVDSRTPLMSADLLRLAAAGHVCTEAGAVLRATAGSRGELDRALAALLTVGHTSGADLATGLAIGLGASSGPEPRKPRLRSARAPQRPADVPAGAR